MHGPLRYTFGSGGTVMVEAAQCLGCGLCVQACPTRHVLELANAPAAERKATVVRPWLCTGCGWCTTACPRAALSVKH